MAAFWGFLFALLCVATFVVGVVAGWGLKELSLEKDKPKKASHGRYEWKDSPKGLVRVSQRFYLELLRTVRDKNVRIYTYDRQRKLFIENEAYDAFRNSNIDLLDFPEVKDEVQYYYDASKDFLFSVAFINEPSENRAVINFGTPKLIGEGDFYIEADGSNTSNLVYDPLTESFIRDNGAYMYCQEIIREDLVSRLKEDGIAYIHWSGDNTYSQVTMREDEADEGTDNTTSGD